MLNLRHSCIMHPFKIYTSVVNYSCVSPAENLYYSRHKSDYPQKFYLRNTFSGEIRQATKFLMLENFRLYDIALLYTMKVSNLCGCADFQ